MGRAEERRARQQATRRAGHRQGRGSRRRGGQSQKSFIRRLFTWKKVVGTLLGLIVVVIGGFVVIYNMVQVPAANAAAKQQSNVYKYGDGKVLARTGEVNREIVGIDQVPKGVQHTFVALENKTFYQDSGVDFRGTARALFNTVTGKGKQGGSTITQQYVKNYYLSQNQTISRKLKELVISLKVDSKESKNDILAGYINTSYFGRGAYGIQAAAQAYYGVDASQLTVDQGAYLAALLQAPSQYDWAVASPTGKKLVTARWNKVLTNMVAMHWLSAQDRASMKFPVPQKPKPPKGEAGQTGYLVDAANKELESHLEDQGASPADAQARVAAGGWTITLNIDPGKEKKLEDAVKTTLTSKLDKKKRPRDADAQAGAVSVDPKTGRIVAMYGGVDYLKHATSNATRQDFQPGSTFKPVIFATALKNGSQTQDGKPITASTMYDGTSGRPVVGSSIAFAPTNEDHVNYGKITVQKAMDDSVNSVFAQMGVDVGMSDVLKMGSTLGMNMKNQKPYPSQTLGTMGASPLQMAGVYATFDNHGKLVTPAILKSAEHGGEKVKLPDPIGDQVLKRSTADAVTSVLTGVVKSGTATMVRNDKYQVAGKTGTSENDVSAWFSGFTPNLVTSVGLFGEAAKAETIDGKKVHQFAHVPLTGTGGLTDQGGRVNGGGYPAEIWNAYVSHAETATGKAGKFDLKTDQGAGVKPTTSPSNSQSPSSTPSETTSPTHSASPPAPPTSSAPASPPASSTDGGTPSDTAEPPGGSPSSPTTSSSPPVTPPGNGNGGNGKGNGNGNGGGGLLG
ncbi:transglycosylase domain-containing protein [Streptomyces montanisoli]|uniref:Transglycosylase domain-containing protein n=1 Tax=Streptomyces montanisoli TaxID=2798581 RepID=A0A940MFI8_9ACTN|nr:transglycosylase domain-containing protein [Streptomyces montanisoli]MBP0458221.1 transglycosylase domain-containing protein [Streptomyces montanisoli]